MAGKWSVFAVFAILGFVGGIMANVAGKVIIPKLIELYPELFKNLDWLLSGFGGAVITILILVIWASFSPQ